MNKRQALMILIALDVMALALDIKRLARLNKQVQR